MYTELINEKLYANAAYGNMKDFIITVKDYDIR